MQDHEAQLSTARIKVELARSRAEQSKHRIEDAPKAHLTYWNKFSKALGYIYYSYLRIRKKLHITKENVSLSYWFSYYAPKIAPLINPGGSLLLREGTHVLSAAITPNSNTKLCGTGWGTILQVAAATTINAIEVTSKSNVTISDLQIDGNKANNTTADDHSTQWCIHVSGGSNIRVEGVLTKNNFQGGILFYNTQHCQLRNSYSSGHVNTGGASDAGMAAWVRTSTKCSIIGCHSESDEYGFLINNLSHDNLISGCVVNTATNYGIEIDDKCYSNVISGCAIIGGCAHGSILLYDGASYNVVTGCTVDGGSALQIGIQYGPDGSSNFNTIIGNNLRNAVAYAIQLEDSSYNLIANNTVVGATAQAAIRIGIATTGGTGNQIVGNHLYGNKYGIQTAAQCTSSIIKTNMIVASTSHGIYFTDRGEGNIVTENTIVSNGGWGVYIADYVSNCKISGNYTASNTSGSICLAGGGHSLGNTIWNNAFDDSAINDSASTVAFDNYHVAWNEWWPSINPPTGGR